MAVVHSSVLVGIEIAPVRVEAVCSPGFSGLHLLGLPGEAAREARERVRVALEACGVRCEEARITVQFHAEVPLRAARSPLALLDFAIAVAVLLALRESDEPAFAAMERPPLYCAGSLTLAGALEARDAFPYLEAVAQEVPSEWVACVPCPRGAFRAADDSPLHRARTFTGLRAFEAWMNDGFPTAWAGPWLSSRQRDCDRGEGEGTGEQGDALTEWDATFEARYWEALRGWARHPSLALALTLALAGRLNVMLMGSPGIGKTHALGAYAQLLPPLAAWERAERRLITAASEGDPRKAACRPFRSPHHACSVAGLVGNASLAPGEFTLAHRGVLFLDEFLEFARTRTEALREPLESGRVSLSRARGQVALPADFQLLAATNPCRCGLFFSARRACRCAPRERLKALESLSGPLLDRFHLRFLVESFGDPAALPCPTTSSRRHGTGRPQGATFDTPPAPLIEQLLHACEGGASFEALARSVKEAALDAHRTKGTGEPGGLLPVDLTDPIFSPETGGPFPNVRARVHAERLLRTATAVFPEEAARAGTAGLLAALLPLRSLDATLDEVLLYDAYVPRSPVPASAPRPWGPPPG